MPPKKAQEPEKKPLIGRVGTNLKVGIVGVPNVGKSTFFNVLTKSAAAAENFPFCTIDPNENKQALKSNFDNMIDFYLRSPSDLSNYSNDQSIIVKKKYLKHLSRIKYTEEDPFNLPQILDWYPLSNSYYAYTEDVDAYARVNHLLSTKPSFESFTSLSHCQNIYEGNVYSEKEAQIQYLSSNPISFLIVGKPGIGEHDLGKLLADYWKCVYIDPQTLITEEIQSDTRAGECIEFNLRSGRAIGVDVIMRLMEKRVKSKSAHHRGFVICGFPLLPNDLYTEDPLSSESAVFNVREIFDEVLDITVEIGIPPPSKPKASKASKIHFEDAEDEEEPDAAEEVPPSAGTSVKLPPADDVPLDIGSATMSNICTHGEYETNFEDQIDFIFSQFSTPFILIYMMCSNTDVISKRKDCCFDFYSKEIIDLQREHSDKMVYTVFSRDSADNETPDDIIDVVKNNTMGMDTSSPRQLVRLPKDFPANVATLLDRYRYSALPVIERHVLIHNREYLIKVDGRISPVRMFNAVKLRLRILPLQRVVIPEKLLKPAEAGLEGGAAEELDIEGLSHAECFEIFKRKQISSTMFKWSWSDWGIKCPVSMSEGDYLDGDPKFAVHFMNKIYFLVDQEAYLKFYRNPRPYLLPPYPKPSCKIFVIGPRCSGKSAVAQCLGYLLRGEILDFQQLEKKFLKLKQNEYLDKIHSAALHEGIVLLDQNRATAWQNAEIERELQVDNWVEQNKVLLEDTMTIIHKYPKYMKKKVVFNPVVNEAEAEEAPEEEDENEIIFDISSFPVSLAQTSHTSRPLLQNASEATVASGNPEVIAETVERFRCLVDFDGIPHPALTEMCKELINDEKLLKEKLPIDLQPPMDDTIEPATVFDDFVKDFANDAVANASLDHIHLTVDHTAEMLIETIKQVEEKSELLGDGRGGWIVDGIPPQSELFEKVLQIYTPKDIFVLKDEPEHKFLLERFETKGLNLFRDFRRFFMDIGKTDAAWRSPSLRSTASYKTRTIKDIIGDVLDESFFVSEQNIAVPSPEEESDPYFRKHPRRSAVEAYTKDLIQFDQEWETLAPTLSQYIINVVELTVTEKSFYVLLKELIKGIDDRYRQLPTVFTDDDKLEELQDFSEPEMLGEELGEAEEQGSSEDGFFQNRRFGDTFNYCPVTFHKNFVLWRGKEEYTVKFEDKLYLMSSETAMGEFLEDPRLYLVGDAPPSTFPPPRICVVGVNGVGKTTICRALYKNIGVYYKSLDIIFKNFLAPKSKFDVNDIIKMGISGAKGEIIEKYLSSDEPIVEQIWNDLITPLWLENPLKTFGFVFDGFPKRPSDVKYMIQRGIVPDIIVEMIINETELYNRLTEKFIEEWEIMQEKKHEMIEKQRLEITNVWKETCEVRFNELMEKLREERYQAELAAYEEEGQDSDKTKSINSFNSIADEEDIEMANNILLQEMPAPVFEDEPEENLEEAVVKFSTNLEEGFHRETEFLRVAREQCDAELIPWVTIDAGMAEDKVFAQLMRNVDKYKFRNNSIFERVYLISVDLADRLLCNGNYFLSKFGKTCPVQIYENINPVQMFIPLEDKFQLYPAIHRQYIYFLAKRENLDKFRDNPLLYTRQKSCGFPLVPLRIAIIGPPKSGKTVLAERFKRDLSMKVVSRGQAARYVLTYLEFSELAKNMESVLQCGWELTNEMVVKSVEAATFDGKSITQGFVLDGFPCCIEEARHLTEVGLVPHLVIDLQAEHIDVFEFLGYCKGKRNLPVFSEKFIEHRYEEWINSAKSFREWFDKEYQITAQIFVKPSMWGVWCASFEYAAAGLSEIQQYYKLCKCDVVLRLGNMQVTPLEFIERQGGYKSYCPCCLFFENALTNGGNPPDRTGVVQFRKYFYYICNDHIELFVDDPEKFIPPYSPCMLPPDLPIRVYPTEAPIDCYEEGICVICYWESQPLIVLTEGVLEYAVSYKEKVFLFDSEECLIKFMRQPFNYYSKKINFKGCVYPSLHYKELPIMGFLQQYDAKQLIKAIVNTGITRPIIPALSIEVSGCINIALFLKMKNPRTPEKFLPLFSEAQNKYHEMRIDLMNGLAQMKRMINPYIYYDELIPEFVDPIFKGETGAIGDGADIRRTLKLQLANKKAMEIQRVSGSKSKTEIKRVSTANPTQRMLGDMIVGTIFKKK